MIKTLKVSILKSLFVNHPVSKLIMRNTDLEEISTVDLEMKKKNKIQKL